MAPTSTCWIASPLPSTASLSSSVSTCCPRPFALPRSSFVTAPKRPRLPSVPPCRAKTPPVCTAAPNQQQEPHGISDTALFYAALVGAQLLPFWGATSGLAGDVAYFSITALSCIVIGVRRAPYETEQLATPLEGKQALAAPFTASIFLFSCYLLLKYTTFDINALFNVFTTFAGSLCLKESLDPIFLSLFRALGVQNTMFREGTSFEMPEAERENKTRREIRVEQQLRSSSPWRLNNVAASVTTAAVIGAYLLHAEPNFVLSNVIAVGLATRVLSLVQPSSFLVASGLLVGLFFYDVYWVFGSEVMVKVATNIDTPGKLLFPRVVPDNGSAMSAYPYAILGLGDVCIPGIFVSMSQNLDEKFASHLPKARRPYFLASTAAYIAALFTCFGANFITGAAQPALIYFSPALISSNIIVAAVRGELKDVIAYKLGDGDEGEEAGGDEGEDEGGEAGEQRKE